MLNKFRQFSAMKKNDRRLFVRIALILPFVEIGLRLFGFNRLLKFLRRFAIVKSSAQKHRQEVERHRRFMFLFYEHFPFAGKCLARALTLWLLLERKGIETNLRFGIRKEDGKLLAHAWVEHKGKPLTVDPEVEQQYPWIYEPITLKH